MLKSVDFMSLAAAKSVVPTNGVAVISIYDSSTTRDLPTFDGFFDGRRVNMLDVCEDYVRQTAGSWPDEPSCEQHLEYCDGMPNDFAPSLSHARAIRAFVDELHSRTEVLDLVVHCSKGVSRSAAVAWWTGKHLGFIPRDGAGVGLDDANPRIKRLLSALD
jgi:hypothetical protein